MKTLNFITVFFIIVFVSTATSSFAKKENLKTTERIQGNSPKLRIIAEESMLVMEASIPVVQENVNKGEKLFKEKNCAICHLLDTKLVGPSLKEVSKAYAGKKEKLNSFLKGDSESIIDPAQHAIMAPQITITKEMSEEDRLAIVEYLLSVK